MFITNDGEVRTKDQELSWLRDNAWSGPDDFEFSIEDIVFLDDDTAIVYGHGDSTRKDDEGKPCAHSYRSSNTFQRVGDEWRPSFSHVSGARCAPLEY